MLVCHMGTCLTPSGRTPCHEPRSRKGESPEGAGAPCVSAAAAGVTRFGGVRGEASCSPRVDEVCLIVVAVAAVAVAVAATGAVTAPVTAAVAEVVMAGLGAVTAAVGAMIETQRRRALATTSLHDLLCA